MWNVLNTLIDSYRDNIIKDTMRLVSKNSVNTGNSEEGAPFGRSIAVCLEEALAIARELGLETRNYDGYAGTARLGDRGKEIGILAHLDVVPAGEGWSYEPFHPVVVGDRIYGRGTVDDKGPVIACLYALKAIRDSGLPIKNHAVQIMGTDEEGGLSRCIKYYLTQEEAPWGGFSPDASFPAIHAEKGILRYTVAGQWDEACDRPIRLTALNGGAKINIVPPKAMAEFETGVPEEIEKAVAAFPKRDKLTLEKNGTKVIVHAKGVGAHAMQPWEGESAVTTLLELLDTLDYGPAGTKDYLGKLARTAGKDCYGRGVGVACEDDLSGPLSNNLGILTVNTGSGKATVEMRYPIHADREILLRTAQTTYAENGLIMEVYQDKGPLYVPKKDPLVQTLVTAYREVSGRNDEAIAIGGATYCRAMKNFVAFGPVFPGQKEMAHEADEFIGIPDLILSAKIYAQALYMLLND